MPPRTTRNSLGGRSPIIDRSTASQTPAPRAEPAHKSAVRLRDHKVKPVRKSKDELGTARALGPAPLFAPPPSWKAPDPPSLGDDPAETMRKRQRGRDPTVWQLNPITKDVNFSIRHDTGVRRSHLRRLLDLAHLCLERGDVRRARRAWAILSRCAETQAWWTDGLIRDLVDAPLGSLARKELIAEGLGSKTERLRLVILDFLATGDTRSALDEIELCVCRQIELLNDASNVLTDPYRSDSLLHFYAGCCALVLAQQPISQVEDPSSDDEMDTDKRAERPLNLNPTLASDARGYFREAASLERAMQTSIDKEAEELIQAGVEDLPSYPQTHIEDFARRYLILIDGHAGALESLSSKRTASAAGSPLPDDDFHSDDDD